MKNSTYLRGALLGTVLNSALLGDQIRAGAPGLLIAFSTVLVCTGTLLLFGFLEEIK